MTVLPCLTSILLASAPAMPSGLRLLDAPLRMPTAEGPVLAVGAAFPGPQDAPAAAGGEGSEEPPPADGAGAQRPGAAAQPKPKAPPPGSLDFDLLGAPKQRAQVDEHALRLRRTLLTWHQGVGLGMFALQLATTAVGQLNYGDKFGGDNTGKYAQPHAVLAYSTLAAFAATGALALFAPAPVRRDEGFDRVSLHKLSMIVATAGMIAQGVLGVWTQSREGYLNQKTIGTAHLAVGYVTLAAVATGIGALVF